MIDVQPVDRPFGFTVSHQNDLHRHDVNGRRALAPVASRLVNQDLPSGPGGADASAGEPVGTPQYTAAWYPDPTRRFEFRYHNGQAWTGDVSVDGNRFLDPLPSFSTAAPRFRAGPAPAVAFVGLPFQQRESIAAAMAALVLGICSILVGWVPFLCFLSAIGAVVGLVLGITVLRRDARLRRDGGEVSRGHGYATAGVVLAPIGMAVTIIGVWLSVVTLREVDRFTNVGAHHTEILSCRVSDGLATATGTITNDSASTRSYHLNIDFDRAGTSVRLNSSSVSVDDVGPDESANWTVTESVRSASGTAADVDCNVHDVTGPVPFGAS